MKLPSVSLPMKRGEALAVALLIPAAGAVALALVAAFCVCLWPFLVGPIYYSLRREKVVASVPADTP